MNFQFFLEPSFPLKDPLSLSLQGVLLFLSLMHALIACSWASPQASKCACKWPYLCCKSNYFCVICRCTPVGLQAILIEQIRCLLIMCVNKLINCIILIIKPFLSITFLYTRYRLDLDCQVVSHSITPLMGLCLVGFSLLRIESNSWQFLIY